MDQIQDWLLLVYKKINVCNRSATFPDRQTLIEGARVKSLQDSRGAALVYDLQPPEFEVNRTKI